MGIIKRPQRAQERKQRERELTDAELDEMDRQRAAEVARVKGEGLYRDSLEAYLAAIEPYLIVGLWHDEHNSPHAIVAFPEEPVMGGFMYRGRPERVRDRAIEAWKQSVRETFPYHHAAGDIEDWPIVDGLTPYGQEEGAGEG